MMPGHLARSDAPTMAMERGLRIVLMGLNKSELAFGAPHRSRAPPGQAAPSHPGFGSCYSQATEAEAAGPAGIVARNAAPMAPNRPRYFIILALPVVSAVMRFRRYRSFQQLTGTLWQITTRLAMTGVRGGGNESPWRRRRIRRGRGGRGGSGGPPDRQPDIARRPGRVTGRCELDLDDGQEGDGAAVLPGEVNGHVRRLAGPRRTIERDKDVTEHGFGRNSLAPIACRWLRVVCRIGIVLRHSCDQLTAYQGL